MTCSSPWEHTASIPWQSFVVLSVLLLQRLLRIKSDSKSLWLPLGNTMSLPTSYSMGFEMLHAVIPSAVKPLMMQSTESTTILPAIILGITHGWYWSRWRMSKSKRANIRQQLTYSLVKLSSNMRSPKQLILICGVAENLIPTKPDSLQIALPTSGTKPSSSFWDTGIHLPRQRATSATCAMFSLARERGTHDSIDFRMISLRICSCSFCLEVLTWAAEQHSGLIFM